jgi:GNAT superfamily N-acetyltransferase
VCCVAGYRVSRNLAWGEFLYVDDLVTDEATRSHGFGKALLAWLVDEARRQGCAQLHLDSGMQRKDAHRFYLREGLDNLGYHFAIKL